MNLKNFCLLNRLVDKLFTNMPKKDLIDKVLPLFLAVY